MSAAGDYRVIRALAVHTEDVAAALEANRTTGSSTVLRITPPFSGRMRARPHVAGTTDYGTDPNPIHVEPGRLVDAPSYPTADETERRLRADPETDYSVEVHHERHTAAVAAWRESVAESVVDSLELDGEYGPHEVAITGLG